MIGATKDGSSETGLGELADQADVKTYLDSYTSDWTEPDPDNPGSTIAFNQTAAAGIWAKKNKLGFKWLTTRNLITHQAFGTCVKSMTR